MSETGKTISTPAMEEAKNPSLGSVIQAASLICDAARGISLLTRHPWLEINFEQARASLNWMAEALIRDCDALLEELEEIGGVP